MSFRGNGSDRGNLPEGECLQRRQTAIFIIIRVRLFSFLPRGISRLTLEMTTCPSRGEAVGRAGRPRPAA